jgi:hypothetical protein
VPSRFDFIEHPDRPAMILTDLATGRKTKVSLCDPSAFGKCWVTFSAIEI